MPKVIGGSLEIHRDLTRERIFEALARLMHEQGYDAITLADVAQAAGLARTAIYNYVPDKESLLVEYATRETDRYLAGLREALAEVDDPVGELRTYLRHQLTHFSDHHLPSGPALRHLLPHEAFARVHDHVGVVEQVLLAIVEHGVAERYMASEDPATTTSLINACTARGSALVADGADREATVRRTEAFVLRALDVRLLADGTARRIPRRR